MALKTSALIWTYSIFQMWNICMPSPIGSTRQPSHLLLCLMMLTNIFGDL
uniref:Uncharacterized protein n=1 Tax=Anguilla anguilla TaxID=7936 RepID=A0A0E9PUS6_ANGAN